MKKFLKYGLIVLIALGVIFVAVGTMLPSHWAVERSVMINAPPEKIYPLVANFKTGWPKWSAFENEDPEIKYTYSGPDEGEGATRSWTSKKMGDGSMKITKANEASGIYFQLEIPAEQFTLDGFLKFEPSEGGTTPGGPTKVIMRDSGYTGENLVKKFLFAMMDKMMGPTFEKSLASLKASAEGK